MKEIAFTLKKIDLKSLNLLLLIMLVLLLVSCTQSPLKNNITPPIPPDSNQLDPRSSPKMYLPPPALPILPSIPLEEIEGVVKQTASLQQVLGSSTSPLEMRLLLISPVDWDYSLQALKALCEQVGIPYEVLIATQEDLTLNKLVTTDGVGRYQGIFLTDGALTYYTGSGYASAFSDYEWNLLWDYERSFDVRQVAMYTWPGTYPEDLGIRIAGYRNTDTTPLNIKLTSAGQEIFSSLRQNTVIPVRYAYTYLGQLDSSGGEEATPLIVDTDGNVVAVMGTSNDGRERVTLTMAHNPYLAHSLLLSFDLLNWVTQGIFIGERRMYLHIDIDDWYQESDLWNSATQSNYPPDVIQFRISGKDALATRTHINSLGSSFPVSKMLNYAMFFNSGQANLSATVDCSQKASLSSATLCLKNYFFWANHTVNEFPMDFISYQDSIFEIGNNILFAQKLGLNFNQNSLVTGTHSGLGYYPKKLDPLGRDCLYDQVPDPEGFCQFGLENSNKEMLRAAADLGVRYMGSNRGLITHTAECETCGIVHPLEPRILLVPRYPTNVFYNVTNPDEVVSEYNYFYGPKGVAPHWDHDFNYDEYLDAEAAVSLYHVISFSPYPHFFHQANLHEYAPGKSLVTDWTQRLLTYYSFYYDLPLITLDWSNLGELVQNRTSFHYSGATGVWDRANSTITLSAQNEGAVYITGIELGTSVQYGDKTISKANLTAGGSQTFSY